MKKIIFLIIVVTMLTTPLYGATYYISNDGSNDKGDGSNNSPWQTLQYAMGEIEGGETIIVKDGLYTGEENAVTFQNYPPDGTADQYTTIRAETLGGAIFDGENVRQMFSLYGTATRIYSYMQFEGMGYRNSSDSLITLINTDHIKMLRCFGYDAVGSGKGGDGFIVMHSSYILFEECWSYGAARKHFYIGKSAEKVVLRRCVVRHDRHYDYMDQEAFNIYDARQVEIQNCISIDGDQGSYYTGGGDGDENTTAKSFLLRNTDEGHTVSDVYFRGCMSVGNDNMIGMAGSNDCGVEFRDCVHWDSYLGVRMRGAGSLFDHCLIGDIKGTGTWAAAAYLEAGDTITNSLLYDAAQGIWSAVNNDYNALFAVGTESIWSSIGAHTYTQENNNAVDPLDGDPGNGSAALKYLVRIEKGSDLDATASDGGVRGATIIKKTGLDETMWGEPGYNELTDEDLWPYPNEGIIRETMGAYSFDNGNLRGNRGFCANIKQLNGSDDITLTSYIWEYLGNPISEEIYDGSESNCDVTNDGKVNIQDLIACVNAVIGGTDEGDVNSDGKTDKKDVISIVNANLSL